MWACELSCIGVFGAKFFGRLIRAKIIISARKPRRPCYSASPPRVSMESRLFLKPLIGRDQISAQNHAIT